MPPSAACATCPIVAQMTTEEDGNSLDGTPPEQFAPALEQQGPDVIGVNCSVGPGADARDGRAHRRRSRSARLAAQPNAGRPRDIEGRNIYLSSPEYMASYARRFIASGVRLVGGCCGTTPEHIRQIKAAVTRANAVDRPRVMVSASGQAARPTGVRRGDAGLERWGAEPGVPTLPLNERSQLARSLAEGRFSDDHRADAAEGVSSARRSSSTRGC